jgi:hypothetical protein
MASATVLAGAALYTVVRAVRLKLDYYDAFLYLYNASRLAGHDVGGAYDDSRPWLLSVVQLPAVLVARLLGPGNPWLLRGPHLVSAAMSLGGVALVVWLLRMHFGKTLALLGGALFVAGRCYVHYCANTMTDLPVAGLCTLTLALHLIAVRRRQLRWFLLAGVAFGAAISMKFTAAMFVVVILGTELASLVEIVPATRGRGLRFNLDVARRLWLVVEGAVTAATYVALQAFVFGRLYGHDAWARYHGAFGGVVKLQSASFQGEKWQDNLPMLVTTLSVPMLILAGAGALATLARPRRADIPFWAWVLGFGGGLIFGIQHNETRYLLPIVPGVIYFVVRGAESLLALGAGAARGGAWARRTAVGVLVAGTLAAGAGQLREDSDPIFYRDLYTPAMRALAARRPGGPAYVVGWWQTLTPATPGPVVEDECWNTFHVSPFIVSYWLGEQAVHLTHNGTPHTLESELFERMVDGDRMLRLDDDMFMTGAWHSGPRDQSLQVWRMARQDFAPAVRDARAPADVDRVFVPAPGSADAAAGGVLKLRVTGGRASVVDAPPGGPWRIFTRTPARPWAYAGDWKPGSGPAALAFPDGADVDRVAFFRVDVDHFGVD